VPPLVLAALSLTGAVLWLYFRLTPDTSNPLQSVVGVIQARRAKSMTVSMFIYVGVLAGYILLSAALHKQVDTWALTAVVTLAVATVLNEMVFTLRIMYGFYGFNAREAREVITAMQELSESDVRPGDWPKSVLPVLDQGEEVPSAQAEVLPKGVSVAP
jgi:hypothetical protein